jgi:hypothetical protein
MALSDQETLLVYQHLHRVFKEDLHISRPLVQMLRHMGLEREASECAFLTARHMLASHQPASALGFLEICRQIGHPSESDINALMVMAELTGEEAGAAKNRVFPLLEQLSDGESLALIRHGSLHRFPAGADVLVQGEVSQSFYLILAGDIHIHMQADGHYLDISKLSSGDFFGEFASVYHLPRSATATTLTPALLLELSEPDIQQLMESSPLAGEYLLDIVKRRMVYSLSCGHPALHGIATIDRDWLADNSQVLEFPAGALVTATDIPSEHCAIVFLGEFVHADGDQHVDVHDLIACSEQPFVPLRAVQRSFVFAFSVEVFQSFRNAYAEFDAWVNGHGFLPTER